MRSCLQVVLVSIALFFSAGLIIVTASARTNLSSIDLSADTPLIPMATVSASRSLPDRRVGESTQIAAINDNDVQVNESNGEQQADPKPALVVEARTTIECNLRAGPGITYEIIGTHGTGELLDVIAVNNAGDWYELADGAWIAAFLVMNPPSGLPLSTHEK